MSSGQSMNQISACDDTDIAQTDKPIDWDYELEKRRDETVVKIISCLDESITHAKHLNLLFIAHILSQARETIIHWTAQAGFENTRKAMPDKLDLMTITCRVLALLLAHDN